MFARKLPIHVKQRIGWHQRTFVFWVQRGQLQAYTSGHSFTEGTLCLQASDPGSVIVGDDVQDVQVSHANPYATQCRQSWCESKSLRIFNQISNVNSTLEDETTLFNCLFTFMVDHLLVPKFCLCAIDFQHDLMVDFGRVKRVEAGQRKSSLQYLQFLKTNFSQVLSSPWFFSWSKQDI